MPANVILSWLIKKKPIPNITKMSQPGVCVYGVAQEECVCVWEIISGGKEYG